MAKIAVVILADKETHEGMGRVANALETVKEAKEQGDEVRLIFDGAGTVWVPELMKKESKLSPLFQAVSSEVTGACAFCAAAFGVKDAIKQSGVPLISEYDGHPSLRRLIADDFAVITF